MLIRPIDSSYQLSKCKKKLVALSFNHHEVEAEYTNSHNQF